MLFGISRLAFSILFFLVSFFIIKKYNPIHKRAWYVISFISIIVLVSVSFLIPIEDSFVTFSSPESAFEYIKMEPVVLVVPGAESDFVVAQKDDSTTIYRCMPRSKDGWKIGSGLDTKNVRSRIVDGITVNVYRYKNTSDYYISVRDMSGDEVEIKDSFNSKFYCIKKNIDILNETWYTYYASVQNLNEQYILTVNGKIISVNGD